ncbi:MAG: DUF4381 domain-containing protein [Halioglobus sp.]
MNQQDPLANLQPLRQPELIGWWPPAPGWWLLLALAVVILAVLAYLWRKRRQRNAYRRAALLQLESLDTMYTADGDVSNYITQINALLKSVALRAYPHQMIAAVHGKQWRDFLNQSLPATLQLQNDFDAAAYQKTAPEFDVTRLQLAARHWIRKHRAAL